MSHEFVMVGRLTLDAAREVVVGVLPKTGDVQTYINGAGGMLTTQKQLTPITPAKANEWAGLLQRAATAAEAISKAHEQYQAAIAAVVGIAQ
ncbi:hypothetical protein I5G72_gp48 [Mycobacterium phage Collard]|uniref:Uncharacterized protein n=1 Tax=Mycobacterium phage Collard TaxID=2301704 RepID=A0A385DXE1_9CAUD|nr:hypothetical protein I5G72_gp48 [Mycobacterium phage Collard]AXQ63225.1 hypothetical protein SEA_COLLARD_51 [Mycobacterium phage Collard]UEM46445.1 hypothetical protein SEA_INVICTUSMANEO_51 [Mycobacterium phage InvictusManeo]